MKTVQDIMESDKPAGGDYKKLANGSLSCAAMVKVLAAQGTTPIKIDGLGRDAFLKEIGLTTDSDGRKTVVFEIAYF